QSRTTANGATHIGSTQRWIVLCSRRWQFPTALERNADPPFMKKKQNKHPLGVSALQIILALSLMSMSAVLLGSGFRSAAARGGSRSVFVNPAPADAQQ